MADELGPIVIDPHAFKPLWPALGVWLLLFLTAGDAVTVVGRQLALWFGAPAQAVVERTSRERVPWAKGARRNYVSFSYESSAGRGRARQAVGARGWSAFKPGAKKAAHALGGRAYLDDDLGYSRWRLILFSLAFGALWAWAAARYRFG